MMETDADRLDAIRALGGSDDFLIRGISTTALYLQQPSQSSFDDVRVSGHEHVLHCLWSFAKANQFAIDDSVIVPNEGDFYIADIANEEGMALVVLRRE